MLFLLKTEVLLEKQKYLCPRVKIVPPNLHPVNISIKYLFVSLPQKLNPFRSFRLNFENIMFIFHHMDDKEIHAVPAFTHVYVIYQQMHAKYFKDIALKFHEHMYERV